MKRKKLDLTIPICCRHGKFFIEFLFKLNSGAKISKISYAHPPAHEDMSKAANNIIQFFKLGFDYIVRILISKNKKKLIIYA